MPSGDINKLKKNISQYTSNNLINIIENKIIEVNDLPVMIDADVAELYGVSTKHINQAVKMNPEKFPSGYVIELTKLQKAELVKNIDQFNRLKHAKTLPKAFTEKGLYMLATILKSEQATSTTIAIIETFTKLRNLQKNIKKASEAKTEDDRNDLLQKSGELIAEMLYKDLDINETQTSIELNFAVLKFKHTVNKKKANNKDE